MKVPVLLGILAVQVVVIGVAFAVQFQAPQEPTQFLEFDPDSIDTFIIESTDDTVQLQKNDDQWQLTNGMPADQSKVLDLLDKLAGLQTGWPVATSESTAERFEVTEDSFQKHITLQSGDDTVADFYLGTSPGYQRVHARIDGPVYSVKLSNYEFGSKSSSWLNKQLLRPDGRVSRIERVGGFVLTHGDEGWSASQEGELNPTEVESFAQRFTNLTVYDISDAELPTDPKASFVILDAAGELKLDLYFLEEDEDWVATSNRIDGQFGISTYIAEDMAQEFEDLLIVEETADEDEEDENEEIPASSEVSVTEKVIDEVESDLSDVE